jgi:hypothetical protein
MLKNVVKFYIKYYLDSTNRFNLATSLRPSQSKTWNSNVIGCGLFFVLIELRREVIVRLLILVELKTITSTVLNFFSS